MDIKTLNYDKFVGYSLAKKVLICAVGAKHGDDIPSPTRAELEAFKRHAHSAEFWCSSGQTDDPDEATLLVFRIAKKNIRVTRTKRRVMTCAYQATKEYLANMFGRHLHTSDEDWYTAHPKVETNGLPLPFTATLLNDLVSEYRLGVSHLYVVKGLALDENLRVWVDVLGCNPKSLVDGQTTNAEYIDLIAPEPGPQRDQLGEQATREWRFEFVEHGDLRGAAVVCAGSDGGGHASYKAPRATDSGDWKIALKYDLQTDISYLQPPPTYGDPEPIVEEDISYQKCIAHGKTTFSEAISEIRSEPGFGYGSYNHPWHGGSYPGREPGGQFQRTFGPSEPSYGATGQSASPEVPARAQSGGLVSQRGQEATQTSGQIVEPRTLSKASSGQPTQEVLGSLDRDLLSFLRDVSSENLDRVVEDRTVGYDEVFTLLERFERITAGYACKDLYEAAARFCKLTPPKSLIKIALDRIPGSLSAADTGNWSAGSRLLREIIAFDDNTGRGLSVGSLMVLISGVQRSLAGVDPRTRLWLAQSLRDAYVRRWDFEHNPFVPASGEEQAPNNEPEDLVEAGPGFLEKVGHFFGL